MKKLNPLLLLPGTVFWGCIIAGFATGNSDFFAAATIVGVTLVAALIFFTARASAARWAETRRIWAEGVPATASIVTIKTGGGSVNDHPYVDFVLDVTLPGGSPYRGEVTALVSQLAIPRIQPGCVIAVRVDPKAQEKLVVDAELTPYGY